MTRWWASLADASAFFFRADCPGFDQKMLAMICRLFAMRCCISCNSISPVVKALSRLPFRGAPLGYIFDGQENERKAFADRPPPTHSGALSGVRFREIPARLRNPPSRCAAARYFPGGTEARPTARRPTHKPHDPQCFDRASAPNAHARPLLISMTFPLGYRSH